MQKRKVRPLMSREEMILTWVRDHGEAVPIKEDAQLIGVSKPTIYRCINDGRLQCTPNKRVLVRSLCEYANGFPPARMVEVI